MCALPLATELSHLRSFIGLQQLRFKAKDIVKLTVTGEVETRNIAPLLLLPFVENAFKHSTASQSENIYISIEITLSEAGILHFSCENSFLPVTNTKNLDKGIGLVNVQKRLDLLYPNAHSLLIKEKNNRFQVTLEINLKKKNNL